MNVTRVLVATDFSSHSAAATSVACELAAKFGAELHVIHVAGKHVDEGTVAVLSRKLSNLAESQSQLRVERRVLVGRASREIVGYACQHRIDLIVIGTHGRSGLAHLALGSVAGRVLRLARCPVLAVKPTGAKGESDVLPAVALDESIEAVPRRLTATDVQTSPAMDLLQRALLARATDIHIDPAGEEDALVRFRIDGRLEPCCLLDENVTEHLIHQLKTMANLDITEPFKPQEGRLQLETSIPHVEVRITASPVAGGQAVALRLFARENVFHPLNALGLSCQDKSLVESMLRLAEGIVLVTGPTGAGKTTTVYSMLHTLGAATCNIVSVEDPVEFAVPFVRQMSVDERHGVTMAKGLRTLLRMDPDIIFIGEIRDPEAADIAMRAASSGRRVFSTLHTRDVAATVTALRDLHADNRSLAANLTGVINQRLVRRICQECRQAVPVTDEQAETFRASTATTPTELYEAPGCEACRGTGCHGRVGIFELALINGSLSASIADGAQETRLRELIRDQGTAGLKSSPLLHAANGITSYDEALSANWL